MGIRKKRKIKNWLRRFERKRKLDSKRIERRRGEIIQRYQEKLHLDLVNLENRKRKHEASALASTTRAHSSSKIPRDQSGIPDPKKRAKVRKITKIAQRKMNQFGKAGESDRRIQSKMPKHLFAGKRKMGKTQRR